MTDHIHIRHLVEDKVMEISRTVKEELKIFFMCAKPIRKNTGFIEKYVGIVAYHHEQAIKKAIQFYGASPESGIGIYSHGDFETIENMFRMINTEKIKQEIIAENTPIKSGTEVKKMSFETFKASLIMSSEEYIADPKDKKVLKSIIEKITV